MKIYTYKVNEITSVQKQEIIDFILKKYPYEHDIKQKEIISILKSILNLFLEINDDLFVGYENNKIIGFAFVCTKKDIHKENKFLFKITNIFNKITSDSAIYQYFQEFYHEIISVQPLLREMNFNQTCLVTICQFINTKNHKNSVNWFIRNLLNYYLLQDKNKIVFYKLNKSFIDDLKQFCNSIKLSLIKSNDYNFEIQLNHPLINKFDYDNFKSKNIRNWHNYKFNRLKTSNMWTKTYISPVQPENNIIMVHGVNSYGYTFINLVPFLLNYGNVILLDLPLHRDSKDKSFLNTEWSMIKYALFLAKWINDNQFQNIYLYGHSMGGGIVAILNILLYQDIKGVIIEDGYNGYCSIINQQIIPMTKSLLKSLKTKRDMDKEKNAKRDQYYMSFFKVYKPFSNKIIKFFLNLFVPNILLNVDEGYLLNTKKSLAIYGIMDGVVNAQQAEMFFNYLGDNWEFNFIKNATHSAHEDNLLELKQFVCQYLSSMTMIDYKQDFDLENIQTSVNIGSPYNKKDRFLMAKFKTFWKKLTKK